MAQTREAKRRKFSFVNKTNLMECDLRCKGGRAWIELKSKVAAKKHPKNDTLQGGCGNAPSSKKCAALRWVSSQLSQTPDDSSIWNPNQKPAAKCNDETAHRNRQNNAMPLTDRIDCGGFVRTRCDEPRCGTGLDSMCMFPSANCSAPLALIPYLCSQLFHR